MDTRMLEVVMGLVGVLALVSLLAAVIHEVWVGYAGRRGDVLMLALCSLLGDKQMTQVWRRNRSEDTVTKFSQQLLQHPMLVSQVLGSGSDPVKDKAASYMDSRVFVASLLAHGNERAGPGAARPADPAAWVSLMAAPSPHQPPPTPDLVANLRAMLGGVEQDWPAFERRLCAWYDSVMDRATGWFQRDTQLRLFVFGLLIALAGNINPLVIGGRLWTDPLVRAFFVDGSAVLLELKAPAAASQPAAAVSATSANTKTAARQASRTPASPVPDSPLGVSVDRSLQQLREEVLAWGERRIAASGTTAADPVTDLRRALEDLDNLRDDVQRRRLAWRDGASTEALLTHSLAAEKAFDAVCERLNNKLTDFKDDGRSSRLLDLLKYERNQQLRQSVATAHTLCSQAQGGAQEAACKQLQGTERLGLGQLPVGWTLSNWPGCEAGCQQRIRAGRADGLQQKVQDESMDSALNLQRDARKTLAPAHDEVWFSAFHALTWTEIWWGLAHSAAGWVLIGIASMLGAPFWFDLLGKVAKLRAAGLAAKAASEAAAAAPDGSATGSPSPPPPPDAGGVLARSSPPPPGPAPASAGNPVPRAGRVPLYPNNDIHVLSEQQVRDLYGDIRTTAAAGVVTLTNPGVGAVKRTLVDFSHPVLQGRVFQVHERARAHFQAAFDAIDAAQLGHLIQTCEGTVSLRHIGHDPKNPLSHHCWGIAIDLNAFANGYGVVPAAVGQPGSVRELVPLFNRYGFAWGGHFRSRLDGMHFELALLDPTQPPQPLARAAAATSET